MNERREGQLSTADMARSAEQQGNDKGETAERRMTEDGTAFATTDSRAASTMAQGKTDGNGTNGHREAASGAAATEDAKNTPLVSQSDSERMRSRWGEIQAQFVDEPRRCVEQADSLVAELMKQLAEMFAGERSKLEHEWDRGGEVSTEDLRQALRRYRSFFERLLSV